MCLGVSRRLGGTGVERALEHCDATGVEGGVGVTMPFCRVLERVIPLVARDGKLLGLPPPPFHLQRKTFSIIKKTILVINVDNNSLLVYGFPTTPK